ncbi:50S ribosomal protein L3 [Candidatus Dojkabacteria bacterium]|nr:50S ribosomal protein L3 [Candidatus Dojkabacteria bacterium]
MKKTLITEKKEMTSLFDGDGKFVSVTVLEVGDNVVFGTRIEEKDGYSAFIIKDEKSGLVKEVRVESDEEVKDMKVGDKLEIDFSEGDTVSATGVTKGKGFQGVVKRWGFKGGPKTHGQSDRQRHPGSIGGGTTPGRVYKGKKMAGRMGAVTRTIRGLRIIKIDKENNLIAVKGAIPGGKGGLVLLKSTK